MVNSARDILRIFLLLDAHAMEWEDLDEQLMVEVASKYDDAQQDFETSLTDEQLMDALTQFEEERGEFSSDF